MNSLFPTVGVCGTGAMGQGIAQMAAQAGSQVLLFDAATDRAVQAQLAIATQCKKCSISNVSRLISTKPISHL
jgi:3-hydroxybutyryl-CoA dehydrogenase